MENERIGIVGAAYTASGEEEGDVGERRGWQRDISEGGRARGIRNAGYGTGRKKEGKIDGDRMREGERERVDTVVVPMAVPVTRSNDQGFGNRNRSNPAPRLPLRFVPALPLPPPSLSLSHPRWPCGRSCARYLLPALGRFTT